MGRGVSMKRAEWKEKKIRSFIDPINVERGLYRFVYLESLSAEILLITRFKDEEREKEVRIVSLSKISFPVRNEIPLYSNII